MTQVYMCYWCRASAENIGDIQHAPGCPEPKHQALMDDLASLHGELNRLRSENEQLRSALKVICTWGHMDIRNPEFTPHLVAEDVVALCDKALGSQNITD